MVIYLSIKMLPPPSFFLFKDIFNLTLEAEMDPQLSRDEGSKDNRRNNKTSKLVQALYDKAIAGIAFCVKKRSMDEEVMPASHQP